MKSSRSKRQERRRQKQDAASILNRRVQQQFPEQKLVVGEAYNGVKMSEALKEFIEPYRKLVSTEEAYRKLLVTAIIAWNMALFPLEERKAHLEKILEAVPEEVRADGKAIISELMERKERYFSKYKRMIIDYEITAAGKDYHLVVISTVDEMVKR